MIKIYGGLKHIKTHLFFFLANLPMKGQWRKRFLVWGGVKIAKENSCFIGSGVSFDTVYPENIVIGNRVHVTAGCVLLTHYLNTGRKGIHWLHEGNIVLEDGCFIGTNTIIAKPCTIGQNAIVGAGSVVTKDIPANEVWAGNPAHFIKCRECADC